MSLVLLMWLELLLHLLAMIHGVRITNLPCAEATGIVVSGNDGTPLATRLGMTFPTGMLVFGMIALP